MSTSRETLRARWMLAAIAAALGALAVLLWHASPLSSWASAAHLSETLATVRDSPWAPVIVIVVYVLAGAVEFPLVLLIAATATLFAPPVAFALSLAGSLASSLVFYLAGAKLGQHTMRRALGATLERVQSALARGGVLTIVVLRSIPFAPFSIVNLAAGSLGIALRDYLLGTALGLLPGILVMTAFGERLRAAWQNPTLANMAVLAGILVAWIGLIFVIQRFALRTRALRADQVLGEPAGGGATASSSGVPGSAADRRGRK
jgi:phospholipase D1/2